jgi:hypothetical protein
VVLYDLRPNLFSEMQSKRRTGDKARGEKKALKVKINLASPAKKIKVCLTELLQGSYFVH